MRKIREVRQCPRQMKVKGDTKKPFSHGNFSIVLHECSLMIIKFNSVYLFIVHTLTAIYNLRDASEDSLTTTN